MFDQLLAIISGFYCQFIFIGFIASYFYLTIYLNV